MAKIKEVKRTKITILELLEQVVDVEQLIASVPLNEDQLIEAALQQPNLVLDAGKLRIQKFHKRTMLETRLSSAKADAGLRLRRIRDVGGRKEFTEGAVKERIELNPKVRKLRQRIDLVAAEEEMGKLLQEVFRTRSDAIRNIVAAGKVSVHSKELQLLRTNKTLARAVANLRRSWSTNEE
jgi:hypothetical protein